MRGAMRALTLLAAASLAITALAFVPMANAAPPCANDSLGQKVDCLQDEVGGRCVYGYSRDCIVYNPCNPTYCDPAWP